MMSIKGGFSESNKVIPYSTITATYLQLPPSQAKCSTTSAAAISYIRQFALNQPDPCALPPPLVHAVDTLPERLLVQVVYLVLGAVQHAAVPLRDFQRGFVFAPASSPSEWNRKVRDDVAIP